jgi:2-methylcitrate dehydratase PrpD
MTLAQQIAQRVVAMRADNLPKAALDWSKVGVMDTLGCTLAGVAEDAPSKVAEVIGVRVDGAGGESLVLGTASRTSALDAALINGVAAHVLDYDNGGAHMGGHASAVMVPALLAAAEAFDCSGVDVLVAHAAGFETGSQLGRAVHPMHYESGWHPTSTVGVFAVAAACSRLLNLTAEQTTTALAISTSFAAGTKANFGTMVKSLHVGQCARGGLMAALLARKGFTANADAFDHKQGYFNLFNGAGKFHAEKVLENWGAPLDIIEPGAAYKVYPCCYSTHAAVQAALDVVRQHGGPFKADEIERIDSWTYPARLPHTDRPNPTTGLEGKFSVQYCVGRALVSGSVLLNHFSESALREPAMQQVLPRVHAAAHLPNQFGAGDTHAAEVKVTLKNGSSMAARVMAPLGRTATDPVPTERLKAKFEDCAASVLPVARVKAVSQALDGFEALKSVREFMRLLEVPSAPQVQRKIA